MPSSARLRVSGAITSRCGRSKPGREIGSNRSATGRPLGVRTGKVERCINLCPVRGIPQPGARVAFDTLEPMDVLTHLLLAAPPALHLGSLHPYERLLVL